MSRRRPICIRSGICSGLRSSIRSGIRRAGTKQMKREEEGFRIEVTSRFEGFWRYNVAMTCGCYDAAGQRTDFVTAQSHIADAGSGLAGPPAGYDPARRIVLTTGRCASIDCFLYLIPHTLPAIEAIDTAPPFEVEVAIRCNGRPLRTERHPVNQWSGLSLELKAACEK